MLPPSTPQNEHAAGHVNALPIFHLEPRKSCPTFRSSSDRISSLVTAHKSSILIQSSPSYHRSLIQPAPFFAIFITVSRSNWNFFVRVPRERRTLDAHFGWIFFFFIIFLRFLSSKACFTWTTQTCTLSRQQEKGELCREDNCRADGLNLQGLNFLLWNRFLVNIGNILFVCFLSLAWKQPSKLSFAEKKYSPSVVVVRGRPVQSHWISMIMILTNQ